MAPPLQEYFFLASLACFHVPFPAPSSEVESVENDSPSCMPVIVASPQDPSLTVLKLSIKQHKGGGKNQVLLNPNLFKAIRYPQPLERELQGSRKFPFLITLTGMYTLLLYLNIPGGWGCLCAPHVAQDKQQAPSQSSWSDDDKKQEC